MIVATSGTRISYRVSGDGPPLLLIAGTGYPSSTWPDAFVEPMSARRSVVVYDHRGTGDSPGTDGPYTTRLFAEDAAAVIEAVGGRADVLGHSMGGRVAQWLAHDRPDLVANLVLAASGPGRSSGAAHRADGIPIRTVLALVENGYEEFIRNLQERTFFTPDFARSSPDVVRRLGDAFWAHRPGLEDYLKHVVARQTHDTGDVLQDIRARTLVIVGEADTHEGDTGSHLAQSEFLAARLPNAELVVHPAVTHGLFWQDPSGVCAAVAEWLEGGSR